MNPKDFDIGVLQNLYSTSYAPYWIFATVGILAIILAKTNNSVYITNLFQFSSNSSQSLFSNRNLSSPLLLLNYLIATTLLGYVFFNSISQNARISQLKQLVLIFLGVTVFHIFKTLGQYIVANWFMRKDMFEIKNAMRQYQIIGLILLPITIFSTYQSNDFKYYASVFCIALIVLSYLIFWYFSLRESLQYKISLFYIFLYLCTLEIIPLLLAAKFLLS